METQSGYLNPLFARHIEDRFAFFDLQLLVINREVNHKNISQKPGLFSLSSRTGFSKKPKNQLTLFEGVKMVTFVSFFVIEHKLPFRVGRNQSLHRFNNVAHRFRIRVAEFENGDYLRSGTLL